jgi:NAD(P)H dehydrogenase (quinone)
MSVSPSYLEWAATTAAVAPSDLEVFNISLMTVSQMSLTEMTDSPPAAVALRTSDGPDCPSSMSDPQFSFNIPFSRNRPRNRLPGTRRFGCRLGPDAPRRSTREMWLRSLHQFWSVPPLILSKVYELTAPRSQNMHGVAAEYSEALGRPIGYVDVPFDQWRDQVVRTHNLSDHVFEHFLTMARLHAAKRYDRLTHNVDSAIGRLFNAAPKASRPSKHASVPGSKDGLSFR